jgi:hypothetical protein
MTVIDTTDPVIHVFPANDTIEVGTTGNYLNWTVVELDPGTYNVTINSVFDQEITYNNGTVILDINDLSIGFYNITAVFFDNSGNLANDTVFINVTDTIAPTISEATDVIVEFGTVGNSVNWTAYDVVPHNYTVYIDSINWTSGFWSNGSIVTIAIDGLDVGNHSLQIRFADTTNNNDYAEIVIVVRDTTQPVWLETPLNQVVEYGSAFFYNVNASDYSYLSYSLNDTTNFLIDTLTGEIHNASYLIVGIYPLQINVTDSLGNILSLTITVTVEDTTIPTWIVPLEDHVIELGIEFRYKVNASDLSTISYTLNDTINFVIGSSSGIISNATNLVVGAYGLQITVTDDFGNALIAMITVTVEDTTVPDILISPDNIQYTVGATENIAIWLISDLDSHNYSVFVDDVLLTANTWESGTPVVIHLDGLVEGVHTVEIYFYDQSGNVISDSITVTVIPEVTISTTTTTTTPTTTEPTIPPPEGTPLILLIGGGAAAAVIVVLGIILLKKKS